MKTFLTLPKHIAIIMDGNGRWAKKRFLPRVMGHRAGVDTVRKIVRYTSDQGVSFLTLYAFSTENWSRPPSEVGFLMDLFKVYLEKEKLYLHEKNVRVQFIGLRDEIDPELLTLMHEIEDFTQNNTGLTLILAINYGGRKEIAHAVQSLLKDEKSDLKDASLDVIQEKISQTLQCSAYPEPDLLIRTAGERRISNFLLWHIAYSEFYFSDKLWPEFDTTDMEMALESYENRERRFGAVIS